VKYVLSQCVWDVDVRRHIMEGETCLVAVRVAGDRREINRTVRRMLAAVHAVL